jgi:hypothetical protein
MLIDLKGIVAAVIVTALLAVSGWALRQWRKPLLAVARRASQFRQSMAGRALQRTQKRLVEDAASVNEQVVVRHTGLKPTKVVWDGACPDHEWYFRRDLPMYRRYLNDGRTPPLKSRLGNPPKVGTRRPCPC